MFAFGALLAGLGGAIAAPLLSVEPGMGEAVLILAFVVTVVGGIGSIRGALIASVIVGVIEIIGRSTFKILLSELLGDITGSTVGPSLASMDNISPHGHRAISEAHRSVPSTQGMRYARTIAKLRPRVIVSGVLLTILALLPFVVSGSQALFFMNFGAKVMVFGIAAISLNLILGYGGMTSFGHAAYLGAGGYAVGVLAFYGINDGFLQFLLAIVGSGAIALVFGAVVLRTTGVYFIMITLALTQVLFYIGLGLETFNGEDGFSVNRSTFFGYSLADPFFRYFLVFAVLLLVLLLVNRVVNSRFGWVLRGSQSNDQRMQAIGFPTFRYRLAAFVIAGSICGLAGALFVNLKGFMAPSYLHWSISGDLMVMVVIGGTGTLMGPLFGALVFEVLQTFLPDIINSVWPGQGKNWLILFGPLLIAMVLFAERGIYGILPKR